MPRSQETKQLFNKKNKTENKFNKGFKMVHVKKKILKNRNIYETLSLYFYIKGFQSSLQK